MVAIKQFPVSVIFLFCAIAIYAFFGSPTPDNPGLVEALVGGFLVLSVGAAGLAGALDWRLGQTPFTLALQALFISGLIVPTLIGIYNGNDLMLLLRDMVAFAFLAIPLFLRKAFDQNPMAVRYLGGILLMAGFLFSLRTLLPAFNIWVPQGELLYLSNSPLVLFSVVLMAGFLWRGFDGISWKKLLGVLASGIGVIVILAAMLLDVQRATVGAVALSIVILAIFRFAESPKKALLPIVILAALLFCVFPMIDEALHAMATKTTSVGLNMRVQEAMAVYDILKGSPLAVIAGWGWGAVLASPAVGGLDVNYTHSLLTTLALKGGLLMLALGMMVMATGTYQIFLIFQRDRVGGLALFWPFTIPILLYASHKSLDFGLVLLLISVWSTRAQALHDAPMSGK